MLLAPVGFVGLFVAWAIAFVETADTGGLSDDAVVAIVLLVFGPLPTGIALGVVSYRAGRHTLGVLGIVCNALAPFVVLLMFVAG